jgi:V8-like Glu-specific endopeptidase
MDNTKNNNKNERKGKMKLKSIFLWSAAIMMIFVFYGTGAFAEKLVGETSSISLSTLHPYKTVEVGETIESFEINKPGASFITVHLINLSLNDGDYIEIRDADGALHQTITNEDPGKTELWSFIADGENVFVNLISGTSGAHAYGFDIDKFGYGLSPSLLESTCNTDSKVDIECVYGTPQYEKAKSIGRMYYSKSGLWYLCTGSLISNESHFLSNEHCINSQTIVDTLQVRFNYQYSICGGSTLATHETFYGNAFLVSNYNYDLSLMTLSGDPQATYGYLELDPRDMVLNETVYIPQHPGGRPKMYNDGPVVDTVAHGNTLNSDFGHRVDTEGGSSGSPVLSISDHMVVGLHHWGGCTSTGGQNQAVLMKHVYTIVEPYLPAEIDPTPDIKANASDNTIILSQGDNLSVTISLDPGNYRSGQWIPVVIIPFQLLLFNLPVTEIWNITDFPQGWFLFMFGVDMNPNGVLDTGYYDLVLVGITP